MIEPSFICAVCRREIEMRWNRRNGPDRIVPPICRTCEQSFGSRGPQAGSFMDRRKSVQISALAEALRTAAAHRKWGGPYGLA
jgi:hypothetical protein